MILPFLLGSALASTPYPGAVADDLGMPCSPTCTLCHASNAGGAGTVTQDFGIAMMARGLIGGANTDALTTALDGMAADAVDSDGDGTTDLDELVAGGNPNPDADAFCDGTTPEVVLPEYGCFGGSAAGLFLGVLGLGAVRRRSARIA